MIERVCERESVCVCVCVSGVCVRERERDRVSLYQENKTPAHSQNDKKKITLYKLNSHLLTDQCACDSAS